jgi:hypothetical protein
MATSAATGRVVLVSLYYYYVKLLLRIIMIVTAEYNYNYYRCIIITPGGPTCMSSLMVDLLAVCGLMLNNNKALVV